MVGRYKQGKEYYPPVIPFARIHNVTPSYLILNRTAWGAAGRLSLETSSSVFFR